MSNEALIYGYNPVSDQVEYFQIDDQGRLGRAATPLVFLQSGDFGGSSDSNFLPLLAIAHSFDEGLLPEVGPLPEFLRDSSGSGLPYVKNENGYMVQTDAGEACFWGRRRVKNLVRYSDRPDFSGTNGWTYSGSQTVAQTNSSNVPDPWGEFNTYTLTAPAATANSLIRGTDALTLRIVPHTFSVWLKAGTLSTAEIRVWSVADGIGTYIATKVVTLTSSWQRFAITGTPVSGKTYYYSIAAGSLSAGSAGYVYMSSPQLEEIVGTTNYAPSEYVSRDSYPRSRYFHGAAVDGVMYFNTAKMGSLDTSTGLVTDNFTGRLTTDLGLAQFPSVQQFFLNTADLSTATFTNAAITLNDAVSPDGSSNAIRLAEDATGGTIAHYAQQILTGINTYDGKYCCFSVYAKYGGASGLPFIRLAMLDIDGSTTKSCYFNIQTGVVRTASHGTGLVESLGNGWYRCIWAGIPLGSGASDAQARIYLATADNTPTHVASGKYNWIWLPNFTAPLSATGSDRPVPVPPFHTTGSASNLPGQVGGYNVRGVLGRTNIAVACDYTPYYSPTMIDRRNYSGVMYLRTEAPIQPAGGSYGAYDGDRTGLTIRPNNSPGSTHNSKYAFDFYNGDKNPGAFWQASHVYQVGDYVIPLDTQPSNANSKKIFTCVVAGVSGSSEPSWDSTYVATPDTSTNLTTDGTVRWQCNEPNGISGSWEPYSGAHKVSSASFLGTSRFAWFISDQDYGCYEDGVTFVKQTIATNALFGAEGYSLRYKPKFLSLGGFMSGVGVPGALSTGNTNASLMPQLTSFIKNVRAVNQKTSQQEAMVQSRRA